MRALVTGATGFIGCHLFRLLKKMGYEVSGLAQKGGQVDGDQIISLDISNSDEVVKFFSKKDFDVIFHLAAFKTSLPDINSAKKCIDTNVLGTLNILDQIKRRNYCKIVFASTIEVYSFSDSLRVVDEMEKPEPSSHYGISKLMGEYCCVMYHKDYDIPYVCLRYSSVFGDGQKTSLIPITIERAERDQDIIIYGKGEGCFDFVFIDDVLTATVKSAESDEVGVFNIGSGSSVKVKTICEKIKEIWSSESGIVFDETKPERCYNIQLSIEKAKEKLGYFPRFSIEDGLRETKKRREVARSK